MKRILLILLMAVLSVGVVSCSSDKADKEDTSTSSETKRSRKDKKDKKNKKDNKDEESSDNKLIESEKESQDIKEEKGTLIYAARINTQDKSIMRKILTYEYEDDTVLKLIEYSSIGYSSPGEDIDEQEKESIKQEFIDVAGRINEIDGIDVVTDTGDEEYAQTVTYDYKKVDFDEYNAVREELGLGNLGQDKDFNIMSSVSKSLKRQGYVEIKENDFKGAGSKTYALEQDDGSMIYKLEYNDNAIKRFSFNIMASYETLGLSSKEEAAQIYEFRQDNIAKGAEYKFELNDEGIVIDASFDLENGDCREFKSNDNNFIFNSPSELYMTYIVPHLITGGFREEEVTRLDIL